jgi:glycine/sarcosine N-methyltransferase
MKPNLSFNPEAVAALYDSIADVYANYYPDYEKAVRSQGSALAQVLRKHTSCSVERVLDCSCGIGTQAIGLALNGVAVDGCDISPQSIQQAERNAARFGVTTEFRVKDMRTLGDGMYPSATYDAVISCGNSLAHLLEVNDLTRTLQGAQSLLKHGGIFCAALTDHENKEPRDEQQFYDAHVKRDGEQRKTINFQVWTWVTRGEIYICDDYTLIDGPSGSLNEAKRVTSPFRIWRKDYLFQMAESLGFSSAQWLLPAETEHHNPILVLHK